MPVRGIREVQRVRLRLEAREHGHELAAVDRGLSQERKRLDHPKAG
jgi:hypothetical protein